MAGSGATGGGVIHAPNVRQDFLDRNSVEEPRRQSIRKEKIKKNKQLARRLSTEFGIETLLDSDKELSKRILQDLNKISGISSGTPRTS